MRHELSHDEDEPMGAGAAQPAGDDVPPAYPPGEPPGGSDSSDTGGGDDDDEDPVIDEVDVKDLLRAALEPPASSGRRIADAVHRKIYDASGGRYFADGWSTTPAPRATYIVTSVLMLVVLVLAWLLLTPWGL